MLTTWGTSFASRSTSGRGTLSTRPTSRIAARAAMVPNVMICATRSRPYFSCTYARTRSPHIIEVDVDVRHLHALAVEEALEDESVLERLDVGDVEHVAHHRPRSAASAGTDPHPVGAR